LDATIAAPFPCVESRYVVAARVAGGGYHGPPRGEDGMRVIGAAVEEESGRPLAGLRVRAFDKDVLFDDPLGEAITNAQGRFEISYSEASFRDFHETLPDVYIRVYDESGERLLYSTERAVRKSAELVEHFDVKIPRAKLVGG
jgi:carotenoid cleavage dioxygenase